ncbi:filamentous hemagglutinin N-terminal domain-containing protein [Scytonema hofmannii]|uniref:beta strand repeat-containing protein n=1 Tax=Scytonema hofmannii TaxID=34078 RepID=UPI001F54A823|nr:filamentous hemagglutinin N-terminal domain-containing protein [Scytonema hofmannii]
MTTCCTLGLMTSVRAQVSADGTLSTTVTSPNNLNFTINNGDRVGGNLFHSFREFSVPNGGSAVFQNAADVQNIISRVTGGSLSQINGLIQAQGSANLFLLNPAGISFGQNARLSIGGSFFATTADSLLFGDGIEFSATNPQAAPLLTVNIPIGLRFRDNAIASQAGFGQSNAVVNAGNLTVNPGQNLTLIGGTAINAGQLNAPSGEVTLASVNSESIASLQPTGSLLSLEVVGDKQIGSDISLAPLLNIPGFTVNGNGGIEFAGILVPNQAGTTIVTGSINTSSPTSGGTVKILGNQVGLYPGALINASGNTGGGTVLVGGNYQGQGQLLNALATYVSPSATILANALTQGNGGKIVVWSDQSSRVYGTLQAKGGAEFGDGGLIETSSFKFLDVAGVAVDASASNGLPGTWLIDPRNVRLGSSNTSGSFSVGNPNVFTPNGDDAIVDIREIETHLSNGNNVIITTGNTGTQEGNITNDSFGFNTTNTVPVSLTLQAANDINLSGFGITGLLSLTLQAANDINLSSFGINGPLNIVLEADSDKSGQGNISISRAAIDTIGGQFTATAAGLISLNNGAGINSINASNQAAAPINITAANLTLESGGGITSRTSGAGKAGDVNITAANLTLEGGGITTATSGAGKAGDVNITAANLTLESAGITSATSGAGKAGDVNITTSQSIALLGSSGINSHIGNVDNQGMVSNTDGTGDGGNVTIKTNSLLIQNQAGIGGIGRGSGNLGTVNVTANDIQLRNQGVISSNVTGNVNTGNAGDVNVSAKTITLDNTIIRSSTDGNGSAGNISLLVGDAIALTNGSSINTSISGRGNAGNVTLRAENGDISLAGVSNIFSTVESGGMGNAGKIDIITRNLSLTDGAQLQTLVSAGAQQSNAGNITVQASGTVRIAGRNSNGNRSAILSNVLSGASGNGGNIIINAGSIFTDDALLIASGGNGLAGDITLNARDAIALTNGSSINSSISGRGNAGNVTLRAENGDISLAGVSNIFSTVESTGMGNAGKVDIITRNLSLTDGAQLQTIIRAGAQQSNAGNITVQASGTVRIADRNSNGSPSAILSNVLSGASGNGGNIIINAGSIFTDDGLLIARNEGNGSAGNISLQVRDAIALTNGSQINSSISGRGNAGNVTLRAENGDISLAGVSNIFSTVESGGTGSAGKIDIITRNLSLTDGAQLQTLVSGGGEQSNAGNITVQASGTVRIADRNSNGNRSAILSNVLSGANGNSGNIIINAGSIFTDDALLIARNEGNGLAGDITLNARDQVSLNQSSIQSDGNSGNGGDITLNIGNFLRLQNESLISANARGQQGGNGGNITINTPFIVAFPQNNDITANAGRGSGGQVIINATLFGIAPLSAADLRRLRPNDLDPRQLSTNDITAISRDNPSLNNNNVQVTSPDVDPSRGLVELPETVTDTTQQVAQNPCRQGIGNEFIVTGRGGLPTSPNEALSSNNVRVDLLQPVASSGNSPSATIKPATTVTARRVPAQGWIFNNKGQVVLTAYDPTNTGSQRPFSTAACPAR